MKLEFKIGKKKFEFVQTKRNVKIWLVGDDAVMKEWNLDEKEPIVTARNRKLAYFGEFWNGIVEHVNNVKVKASDAS